MSYKSSYTGAQIDTSVAVVVNIPKSKSVLGSDSNGNIVDASTPFKAPTSGYFGTTNDYGYDLPGRSFVKAAVTWASDNTGNASNRNWEAGVNGYAAGAWHLANSSANDTFPNDAWRFVVTSGGSCYNTTGTYGTISDIKLKENIVDAREYLSDLLKVRVVNYSLKSEAADHATKLGVIAQEVEQIFPNIVEETEDIIVERSTNENGEIVENYVFAGTTTKAVKYSVFVPMLIKAIQELKAELDALKGATP